MIVPMDSSIPNKPGGEGKVERVTQDVAQATICNAASTFSAVAAEEATYYDINYANVLSDMKSGASTRERVYCTTELLIFFIPM